MFYAKMLFMENDIENDIENVMKSALIFNVKTIVTIVT